MKTNSITTECITGEYHYMKPLGLCQEGRTVAVSVKCAVCAAIGAFYLYAEDADWYVLLEAPLKED